MGDTIHLIREAAGKARRSAGRHERKASWAAVALAIVGLIGSHWQGSGDRSALWRKIKAVDEHLTFTDGRVDALEKTNIYNAGIEAGRQKGDKR